jgi:YidC/Oxa1 family membrane protein insertase
VGALDGPTVLVIGVLAALIAGVGELTRRLLKPPTLASTSDGPAARIPAGLLGILQFATAVAALFVPLAAGVYLLVTVAWTLVQRLVLRRRYPVDPAA